MHLNFNYQANFSPDSPFEFNVYPSAGVLPPRGETGVDFVVSFTATEYGKPLVGKLVIEVRRLDIICVK